MLFRNRHHPSGKTQGFLSLVDSDMRSDVHMATVKTGRRDGRDFHYSVGAVIKRNDKYLLIDRAKQPFGFAGPAGHVDKGETSEEALIREIKEETGLRIVGYKLIFEEFVERPEWGSCTRGTNAHHWRLFECEVSGEIKRNEEETKSIGWYSPEQIKNMKLEPVWKYWFEKLGLIKQ